MTQICHFLHERIAVWQKIVFIWVFTAKFIISARNSTTKPKCRRCRTGYYCVGDGTEEKCGVTSPTEYSFGGATNCSACPEGWVRNDVMSCFCLNKIDDSQIRSSFPGDKFLKSSLSYFDWPWLYILHTLNNAVKNSPKDKLCFTCWRCGHTFVFFSFSYVTTVPHCLAHQTRTSNVTQR